MTSAGRSGLRFYTMGDANYFLGAVALTNSLRIVGHQEPVSFLDLGLTPAQRAILEQECDVVDLARDPRDHPFTFQPYAYATGATGICIILDSDVIVTRRLDRFIQEADAGRIAAFSDGRERCLAEWETIFELRRPIEHGHAYVNSGLVALDARQRGEFLERWWNLCRKIETSELYAPDNPVAMADQDALNALLMSEYADAGITIEDPMMVFGGRALEQTRVESLDALRFSSGGIDVAALHAILSPKPWMDRARFRLGKGAYFSAIRRCLIGRDLAIRVDEQMLPSWLRSGRRSSLEASALHVLYGLRRRAFHAKQRLPGVVRTRR